MQHRTDIDGLRAIAVLAITLFHINPALFHGGFVGVDVFFVISGYLITKSIWSGLENGSFTIADFYARRVRRLFPALFFALVSTAIFAYFLLLPTDLIEFSKSAAATVSYVSNFFFYSKSGYFDAAVESSPLLHTWSLSVEEQYYLVFPMFMLAVHRYWKNYKLAWIAVAAAAFLALSQALIAIDPSASFYFSPSRFWQFLIGGYVALTTTKRFGLVYISPTVGWLGLAILAGTLATYDGSLPFPGLYAVAPTIASAMILWSGQTSRGYLYDALSNRPFRFLGQISYSMYLWHWPIIVFYKMTVSPTLSIPEQLIMLIAAIAFGALSYYLVEIPTKHLRIEGRAKFTIGVGVFTSAAIIAVAVFPVLNGGLANRFDATTQRLAAHLKYDMSSFRGGTCFLSSSNKSSSDFNAGECIVVNSSKPNLLLLGDSHAAHIAGAIAKLFPDYNVSQITASGCQPTIPTKGEERCTSLVERALELLRQGKFDQVIISARWSRRDADGLSAALETVPAKTKITVVGPSVEYTDELPRLLAQTSVTGYTSLVAKSRRYGAAKAIDEAIRDTTVKNSTVSYYSLLSAMCSDASHCETIAPDGSPVQFDKDHFTDSGALYFLANLRDAEAMSKTSISRLN